MAGHHHILSARAGGLEMASYLFSVAGVRESLSHLGPNRLHEVLRLVSRGFLHGTPFVFGGLKIICVVWHMSLENSPIYGDFPRMLVASLRLERGCQAVQQSTGCRIREAKAPDDAPGIRRVQF